MSIEDTLKQLREEDENEIQRASDRLDDIYAGLPYRLKVTSELSGIPQEQLIRMAKRAAGTYANTEWHQCIAIMHTMFVHKRNMDEKETTR